MIELVARGILIGQMHSLVMRRRWRSSLDLLLRFPGPPLPRIEPRAVEESLANDAMLSSRLGDIANLIRHLTTSGAHREATRSDAAPAIVVLETMASQLAPQSGSTMRHQSRRHHLAVEQATLLIKC